jgi:hypothetical protein
MSHERFTALHGEIKALRSRLEELRRQHPKLGQQISACVLYVLQGKQVGSPELGDIGVNTNDQLDKALETIANALNGKVHMLRRVTMRHSDRKGPLRSTLSEGPCHLMCK